MTDSPPVYYKEELSYAEYLVRLRKWTNMASYTVLGFEKMLPVHFKKDVAVLYMMPPSHEFILHAVNFCKTLEQVQQFKLDFQKTCERVAAEKLKFFFEY